MSDHLPECPHADPRKVTFYGGYCVCPSLRAWQRVMESDEAWIKASTEANHRIAYRFGHNAGLDAARKAVAALHQRVPVIECACGWGKDCLECGSESNRIVGYACDACCNSFGDHAYCDDLHYDDDTPLHHQDGQMWSGPHCPTLAVIDALKDKP